jgi:aspartyl-tRNA(Asn)/glutamyl-tRNA(Gln) amidotransferase subunit B
MVSDDGALTEAVKSVIADNADVVASWKSGKVQVFGFLMGQVMKKLGKGGNPERAKQVLEAALKE